MSQATDVAGRTRGSRRAVWILSGLLVLLGWGALPRCAAAAPLFRAPVEPAAMVSREIRTTRHERGFLDTLQGNRTRMIQIATLAMLLGLFILMRK